MGEREEIEVAIRNLESQRSALGDAVVDTAVAALREKLARPAGARPDGDALSGERKLVTILFSDLEGFTSLSERMDPEDLRALMNAYFERLRGVVVRHGGRVDKFIGDAIMALFGVPSATEEDPENAVRAALDMRQALGEFNADLERQRGFRLYQRIGVSTGTVIVASGAGEPETVTGIAVNVASRLQSLAPADGILISRDTYRHVRGVFDVVELEPVPVKGISEPLGVYLVEREKPRAFRLRARGVEGVETPTVGREVELDLLQKEFLEVVAGRCLRWTTVVADAGVGKSRLLYEFTRWQEVRPERVRIFKGRCEHSTEFAPYGLVRDLFAFRFEIRDDDDPPTARAKLERGLEAYLGARAAEAAPFVGHLIGLDYTADSRLRGILEDPRQIRERAFHHAARLLAAAGDGVAATSVIFEDIHWADEGSLDFIESLAHASPDCPMHLLCLARPTLYERRPGWGGAGPAHRRMDLAPLSPEASRTLAHAILCRLPEVPRSLWEMIVGRAGGYPLYLEEFVKMLVEEGVIEKGEGTWSLREEKLSQIATPPTLLGVLQARLDALPRPERDTLQMAAIVGSVFWDLAVEAVDDSGPPAAEILNILRAKELVFARSTSSFAGAVEYVFKHALLHDVAYEGILREVRQRQHARVAEWLIGMAGERAGQFAGLIAEHFDRAGMGGRAAEWFGRAGLRARDSYAPEAAIGYLRRSLSHPEGSGAAHRIPLLDALGEAELLQAHYAEAVEAYGEMEREAASANSGAALSRALGGQAWALDRLGDFRASFACADRAVEAAQAADAQPELSKALFRKGWAHFRLGEPGAVLELAHQALSFARSLGARRDEAFSLKLLGVAYVMQSRFDEAARYQRQALETFRSLGDRWGIANLLNNLGETLRQKGDFGAAVATFDEELGILREIGNRDGEIICLSNLGGAKVALRDFRAAETDLSLSLDLGQRQGGLAFVETFRFRAEARLGLGRAEDALEDALRALTLVQEAHGREDDGPVFRILGEVSSALGRPVGKGDAILDSDAWFARACESCSAAGSGPEGARTLRAWARCAGATDPARGADLRAQALDAFERLGMAEEARRLREEAAGYRSGGRS